ncbi:MAG: 23S rRNA (pseudouridine(1915)-N(3))-methyltransferase RlmH [Acidobacteriota bacterium]|nr:23S rRNA (pseudouridine(1915)-N(3))-methyltransferase RlmH [Acidobacteriota bacterium]
MRFRFVWIGKTKDKNWRALQEEYLSRLSHFARIEISEIKESQPHDTKEIEGKRILDVLPENAFAVLLDVTGKQISSHELAGEIENWQNRSLKEIIFIIGGQDGVSESVTARANLKLSLSKMTFTHETARVVLLEQIYRAFTIIHRFPYQK